MGVSSNLVVSVGSESTVWRGEGYVHSTGCKLTFSLKIPIVKVVQSRDSVPSLNIPYLGDTQGHSFNAKLVNTHLYTLSGRYTRTDLRKDVQQRVGHSETGPQHGCETNLWLDG